MNGINIKCENCGTENPCDSMFCVSCGAKISDIKDAPVSGKKGGIKNILRKTGYKKRVVISACSALITVIFIILGVKTLADGKLKDYNESYDHCMSSYNECIEKYHLYRDSHFSELADGFKAIADSYSRWIRDIIVKAVIFFAVAVIFMVAAFIMFPSRK